MPLRAFGSRVRVGGDLSRWTQTAQENLPGVWGTVEDYKSNYDGPPGYPAYLVKFDEPVKVNHMTSFERAWIAADNLFSA